MTASLSRRRLRWLLVVAAILIATGIMVGVPSRIVSAWALARLDGFDDRAGLSLLDTARRMGVESADTLWVKARVARREGRLEDMESLLQQAEKRGLDAARAARERTLGLAQAGQVDAIESRLSEWLGEGGRESAEVCDAYCNGLTALGRISDAMPILQAWQVDFPKDPRPCWRLGLVAEYRQDFEKAIDYYRQSTDRNAGFEKAWYALGRTLRMQRDIEGALVAFERCAKGGMTEAAMLGHAECLRDLGKGSDARKIYESLLEKKEELTKSLRVADVIPDGNVVARELGMMLVADGEYGAAIPILEKALADWANDTESRYAYAQCLRATGKAEQAEKEFDRVKLARDALAAAPPLLDRIHSNPQDTEARLQLGDMHLKYDSPRRGLYFLNSIFSYDPTNTQAHQLLADYFESHLKDDPKHAELARLHREVLQKNSPSK